MKPRGFFLLLGRAGRTWSRDRVSRLAAALAYYTLFSLAPTLIITTSIAGWFFGEQAVSGQLATQLQSLIGVNSADLIQKMVVGVANQPRTNILTTIIGVATLWWAASNLFGQLQQALNTLWNVPPRSRKGVLGFIWARIIAVLMVIGMGFFLMFSLMMLSVIHGMTDVLQLVVPNFVRLAPLVDLGVSLFLLTVVFAIIYQFLPNINLAWRDVLIGAMFTALLLVAGKYLISWYLGKKAGLLSVYGVAGSLVVLLVWTYYSAQILLFGAAFTKAYATTYGSQQARGKQIPAIAHTLTSPQDNPWPTLAPRETKKPKSTYRSERGQWRWQAFVAFVLGLFVGAKKGR